MAKVINTRMKNGKIIIAGKIFSINGASHNPARKPSTTLGSAAIISMTGLIGFKVLWRNCDVYSAAKTPTGTAKSMAYMVPLMVPKMSGVRLSFGSKSSVPPVDCQTNSGFHIPHTRRVQRAF